MVRKYEQYDKNEIRYNNTHNAIKDEYKKMLCEYDINKITASEITKRLGINRKTFYVHFETIQDLTNEILEDILNEYASEFTKLPKGRPHEVANRLFFEFFSKQDEYVQRILCYSGFDSMCDVIFDRSYEKAKKIENSYPQYNDEENHIIEAFYKVSTLGLYRKWILDGRRMSLDEIVDLSNKLICRGVYSL